MKNPKIAFIGDVHGGTAEITLNRKGGSLTATLKKVITDQVVAFRDATKVFGTAISLGDGDGLVLLSTLVDEDDPNIAMRQISENRFEVVIGEEAQVELDAVSMALLGLKEVEISEGRANLSAPMTGEDIRARLIS